MNDQCSAFLKFWPIKILQTENIVLYININEDPFILLEEDQCAHRYRFPSKP